ncbi:MAG TPA: marine proteobacterial sortase target protein [Thermoanaerobaculia bacterium]|jgi:Ca-activated chloride channel family protein|nr:marine proteobacterial sortase target protein [Thermoanaerobaculia bacterium]
MKRLLACIPLMLLIAASALAAEDPLPLVKMDDVKSAAMLLKTSQPGVYAEAPTLKSDVRLHVRGIVLRGEVTQTFENTTPQCAEAVYVFPLPENAAVDTLRMTIGQRVIEGEIQEKKAAQQTYDTAKAEGKHASLLTQERPNLFTVAIANIASGEKVLIDVAYQQTVDYRDGAFSFRFPMAIGPRYIPIAGVADADRIPSSLPAAHRNSKASLTVDLDAGFSLRKVESPFHQINTSVVSGSHYTITLANGEVPADRDFELDWQPDLGSEPKSAVFSEGDYALLMIMPPAQSTHVRMPRETVFVIDTSGSMEGTSINEAKNALLLALDRLQPSDRFNVIEFNSTTEMLFDTAQPATTDAISRAKAWVNALHANGGTEILDAIQHALRDEQTPRDDGVRQVVFMTDGQVGNEDQCFAYIRDHLGRTRLFTVGIGSAPNSHFMRNAARFGRGTFTYIGNVSEVQQKMGGLFEKLENPVLSNVTLHLDDPAAEMWPQRVPDLYSGEPIVVTVKTAKHGGRVIATATMGKEEWNDTRVISGAGEDSGIAKLWARQKIEALLDRDGALAENSADRQQVLDLALANHLVTPLTSLVAVDHTPTGINPATCNTTAIPVNLPAGWGGIDGSLPQTATPGPLWITIGALLLLLAVVVVKY